ncbi:hypothetical protein [Pseudoteredinibacter isoporae]|uniref:Oxygen-independent coproporphyrinogen III oxidase n=1 Tax=Pseudoteredinibacter isoporae TaxID=570281 RepID=A0A7X0JSF3_9GAMM|nr:hypothetical protein [Pseudoteredinibacter isoporae]MBB6521409.1 hypothetical protein [Pseudoteredinibacter isoporae]NHO86964.1 hypothetical protein [Pseudoteredinibacter isoporae]NIB24583.1 hypothetical protein [Pseudoteredinibacter isoporae]
MNNPNALASQSFDLAAQQHPHLLRSASYNYPHRCAFKAVDDGDTQTVNQRLSISPLAIWLNLPARRFDTALGRDFLDSLIAEITLRKEAFGRRPVTQLLLRHPFLHYQGADITELMHLLASNFRLNHRDNSPIEYCAELLLEEAEGANLALLKGLGFNEFLLSLPASPSRGDYEKLHAIWQHAREFAADSLGVRLPYGYPEQDLHSMRALLDQILSLKPDRILLTPASELDRWNLQDHIHEHGSNSASQFALIYNALRHAGYRVLGNDCFVIGRDSLAIAQNQNRLRRTAIAYNSVNAADLLGLGPAASSQLGSRYESNLEAIQPYIENLQLHKLAIDKVLQLGTKAKACRVVADQLLCYHRLDIHYIENRYELALASLAENISWEFNAEANMELMRIHNGLLQLSDDGIMRLLFISDTFLAGLLKTPKKD